MGLSIAIVAALLSGCGATAGLQVQSGSKRSPHALRLPTATAFSRCRSGSDAQSLGVAAYVDRGALRLSRIATCSTRPITLLARGASAPVRLSSDGRWVAYGDGTVVNVRRREIVRPLGGGVLEWRWVGGSDELVGVTDGGGVVIGAPGRPRRRLLPNGWGANSVVTSSDGEIAVTRAVVPQPAASSASIWTLTASGGRPQLAYQAPPRTAELSLATFAPGGGAVAFWVSRWGSASLAADGLPLRLVPLRGEASPVRLANAVLVNSEMVVPCGESLLFVSGAGREETLDKRLEVASPVDGWHPRALTSASRSTISPSCFRAGGEAVAATGRSRPWRHADARRSIALISTRGSRSRMLTKPPFHGSDESPRFLVGGRWVLFVRDRLTRDGVDGAGYLIAADGRSARPIGPLFTVGRSADSFGATSWGESVAVHASVAVHSSPLK